MKALYESSTLLNCCVLILIIASNTVAIQPLLCSNFVTRPSNDSSKTEINIEVGNLASTSIRTDVEVRIADKSNLQKDPLFDIALSKEDTLEILWLKRSLKYQLVIPLEDENRYIISKIWINKKLICSENDTEYSQWPSLQLHHFLETNRLQKREAKKSPTKIYPSNPFLKFNTEVSNRFDQSSTKYENNPFLTERVSSRFSSQSCGESTRAVKLVVNGEATSRNDFPWLAAFYKIIANNGNKFHCAGNLVSKRHVITAAHCVKAGPRTFNTTEVFVSLGRYKRVGLDEGTSIWPKEIHAHPDYSSKTAAADIALVVLLQEAVFSESVKPLCLWSGNSDIGSIVNKNGLVAGWGTNEDGVLSSTPREVVLPVVDTEVCRKSNDLFKRVANEQTFCAGKRDYSGPCTGDSGGGFIMIQNGRWTLRGIVSLSARNPLSEIKCDLYHYQLFTDVAKYKNWIDDKMN